MLYPFFALAMQAPARQHAFRRAVLVHLILLTFAVWAVQRTGSYATVIVVAQLLLVTGIAEGAFLIGWRLTQLPKSQALEFLLASPVHPRRVLLAEALVGLGRLALVTLSGLPLLVLLVAAGYLELVDLAPLLLMPFTWGAFTGLLLTMWAYEPLRIRRWAERGLMVGVIFYLTVGVLAADRLGYWLTGLPGWAQESFLAAFKAFHFYNPFGILQYWMENHGRSRGETEAAWDQFIGLEAGALLMVGLALGRAAFRLKGHFHERHYRPITDDRPADVAGIADRPLAWWAVKRVTEYSGRVNVLLAGGFGVLYAAYIVAQSAWPSWLGQSVFLLFERQMGGLPVLATALTVLAAVPAAFQYGLWDSNAQDRCRRLELLLLTELEPRDYWDAALRAAWRRGRGYFLVAALLWVAGAVAGRMTILQVAAALAGGGVLWLLYFALGFRAFTRGHQANGLGSLLTLGLPFVTWVLLRLQQPLLAGLLPPGAVYLAGAGQAMQSWLPGTILGLALMLAVTRWALRRGDAELRLWYEQHHGQKVIE